MWSRQLALKLGEKGPVVVAVNPKSFLGSKMVKEAYGMEGGDNVTVDDLYAAFPDFMIDVKREQRLCEEHDVIIFPYPFLSQGVAGSVTVTGLGLRLKRESLGRIHFTPHQAIVKLCRMTMPSPHTVLGIHRGLAVDEVQTYAGDYRRHYPSRFAGVGRCENTIPT